MGIPRALCAAAALAAGIAPASAQSDFVDPSVGNGLLTRCESPRENDKLICLAYVVGVRDGSRGQAAFSRTPELYCPPDGVTNNQATDIVIADLRRYPETRHQPSSLLIIAAFIRAFPCPRK